MRTKKSSRNKFSKGSGKISGEKQQQKEEAQIKTNEIVIKKADKLKKINERKEKELKSIINYNDDDVDEIEEHITKKPKKKE